MSHAGSLGDLARHRRSGGHTLDSVRQSLIGRIAGFTCLQHDSHGMFVLARQQWTTGQVLSILSRPAQAGAPLGAPILVGW
jgi:hypothetical protein